ncbi:acetyl-CoA acetyltransferase [bacterium (candidate division B38) B3_B38]|nr:MAG: acetyl-CoA acetyltransferase [bacterium (candidate division B38) B3_B38]
MREVFILSAVRTPMGNFGGALKELTAVELGVAAVKESLNRAGVEPGMVEEVIFASARQAGTGPNIARQISYNSGIPQETPGFTVNKACGSSLKALILAYQSIVLGDADCIVAGGTESMSNVPYLLDKARFGGYRLGDGVLIDAMYRDGYFCPLADMLMGRTAENLAEQYRISRREQDEYALLSHRRAVEATREGRLKEEIVPVEAPRGKRELVVVEKDEHPREDTSLEKLSKLKPVFKEGGTITAGNSSAITDAAASLVVASADFARRLNLKPLARMVSYAVVGVDPRIMGIGPVPATRKLLEKTNTTLEDYGLFEYNEAFAAQMLAVEKELGLDRAKVNVNGGAIALGHPTGATGARIVTTLLHEMKKRGAKRGIASLCVSGGMGLAVSFESA